MGFYVCWKSSSSLTALIKRSTAPFPEKIHLCKQQAKKEETFKISDDKQRWLAACYMKCYKYKLLNDISKLVGI